MNVYSNISQSSHLDFLLFEGVHHLKHHQYDLAIIARMLMRSGLNVAVLDVYGDIVPSEFEGIHVYSIDHRFPVPDDRYLSNPKGPISNFFHYIKFITQQFFYMWDVRKKVIDVADRFYCGSYNYFMPLNFFFVSKECYYWGLRGFYFDRKLSGQAIYLSLRKLFLDFLFRKKNSQKLFVSNDIVLNDIANNGISRNKMVVRQERCVYSIPEPNLHLCDEQLSFLVIGQLREDKQVPLTISAFTNANISNAILRIVGRSKFDYESVISKALIGNERIERINRFLDYEDFTNFFLKSHFVIFADKKVSSSITNGTFLEALINCRPVIAPNYDPYKYYIEHYNVGLLYDPKDLSSFSSALLTASRLGSSYFVDNIRLFLRTLEFESLSMKLISDITATENI